MKKGKKDFSSIPEWMGVFWDNVENETMEELKKRSEEYYINCLKRNKMMNDYRFLSYIVDGNCEKIEMTGLTWQEAKLISDFWQLEKEKEYMEKFYTYLRGCKDIYLLLYYFGELKINN